jgi:hypothetical protein
VKVWARNGSQPRQRRRRAGAGELRDAIATSACRFSVNPFFLEESVRALAETGSLSGERGAYRLARPLATIQVPATIQAVLAARIDRLPPEDKALLQMASVVGKDVPFAVLQALDRSVRARWQRWRGTERRLTSG